MKKFSIKKSSEETRTVYEVACKQADNQGIYEALLAAAQDVWPFIQIPPGTYTAAQIQKVPFCGTDKEFPTSLNEVTIKCGTYKSVIGVMDNYNSFQPLQLFRVLGIFESMTRVPKAERAIFFRGADMGKKVCEARIVLPQNIKAIVACCDNNPIDDSKNYPAIDLNRQTIVASDGRIMVAQKVTVASISYDGECPETFIIPIEVAQMQGEVKVELYEEGSVVTDLNGRSVSVKIIGPYPKWHTVWPMYQGGATTVNVKAMTKALNTAIASLQEKGKASFETVVLCHKPDDEGISITSYQNADERGYSMLPETTPSTEIPFRIGITPEYLKKALALKPTMMYVGFAEYSVLPNRIIFESSYNMAIQICERLPDSELEDVFSADADKYAVLSVRNLHRCYSSNGWLLERLEDIGKTTEQQKGTATASEDPTQQLRNALRAAMERQGLAMAVAA